MLTYNLIQHENTHFVQEKGVYTIHTEGTAKPCSALMTPVVISSSLKPSHSVLLGISLWFPQRSLFFHLRRQVVNHLLLSKRDLPHPCHTSPLEPQHHSWVFVFAVSSAWKFLPVIFLLMCLINECSASFNSSLIPQSTFSRLLNLKCDTNIPTINYHQMTVFHFYCQDLILSCL